MAILALAATIVIINAPPQQSTARTGADEFSIALQNADDGAIVAGGVHRLEISAEKWRIARFENREWAPYWESTAADGLTLTVDVEEIAQSNLSALTGERGEKRKRNAPVIIAIDPFGDAPPFALQFRGDRESWSVQRLADGDIKMARE